MNAVQRIELSDEVRRALDEEPDINAVFALLNAAGDYYVREQRPMPLDEALKTIRQVAAGLEALEAGLERGVPAETPHDL